MANTNIRGIIGFNPSSGTARLLAAYEQDVVNVATGTGYGLNLNTTNNVEFETFLDRVFLQNYDSRPLTYSTSTNKWTNTYVPRTPRSKYIKKYKSRLYLGYCQFTNPQIPTDGNSNELVFPSRVFYSDLFSGQQPYANLTWGLEWGWNGYVFANRNIFQIESASSSQPLAANFMANNIKVGDPLFITDNAVSGSKNPNTNGYLVTAIENPYRLILNTTFPITTDGLDFWVGSNWFDVGGDDGDVITGFGENSDRLLIFKLLSLWFYTSSQLKKIQGAVGTSSQRSVINDKYGNTYYFHGSDPKISGIYKYNGVSSVKASRAIDPYIQGMAAANYGSVVAWAEGNELRFYLGNLSATNKTEAVTKAVATLNVDTGAWDVGPIGDTITCATQWIVSNQQDTYVGTDSSQVLKMNSGNAFKSTAISSTLETKVYYPAGSEIICDFPYIQVIGKYTKGTKVKYKLWNNPTGVDDKWWSLGELTDDKTEFTVPLQHRSAAGIQFKFEEIGTSENDTYIEKISIFYRPNRTRLL